MRWLTLAACLVFGCSKADTDRAWVDFACGPDTCIAGQELCYRASGGAFEDTDPPACQDLPAACRGTPTCACLEADGALAGADCREDGTGGLFLTVNMP